MVKKAKKSKLASRYAESYNSRNSGGKRAGVIDWKKLDGDVKFFTPKEGRNRINIIPYVIKTKNHPLVRSKSAEVGDLDYVLDVYTHRGVGPTESTVLCLKETYEKPCPVCELMQKLKEEGIVWGYDLQYLMTGLLNQHPRTAIQFTKEKRNDYAEFYREVVAQD